MPDNLILKKPNDYSTTCLHTRVKGQELKKNVGKNTLILLLRPLNIAQETTRFKSLLLELLKVNLKKKHSNYNKTE